jgi:NADP-dependent 3-hydroxy acid dehydrogenase YdfG
MSADLSGKTAIVTGASSGIGRAIAERLGSDGAHVVLGGRTEAAMEDAATTIRAAGGGATVQTLDVRRPAEVQALVDAAVAETGRLDVMVNNAGVSFPEPILEADPDHWQTMFDTNVIGLLAGCQAAVKAMRACGAEGHLVNISSIAALNRESGVYGSTKHAVNAITNTLRQELIEDPIQVISIMPGAIATNFARNFDPALLQGLGAMVGVEMDIEQGQRLPDDVIDKVQEALAEQLCSADDVADAVAFAVTRPANVHISELVVRPNKDLQL